MDVEIKLPNRIDGVGDDGDDGDDEDDETNILCSETASLLRMLTLDTKPLDQKFDRNHYNDCEDHTLVKEVKADLVSAERSLDRAEVEAIHISLSEIHQITELLQICEDCENHLTTTCALLESCERKLSEVTGELDSLRDTSTKFALKRANCSSAADALSVFIDELSIPRQMVEVIMHKDPPDMMFIEQAHELNAKLAVIRKKRKLTAMSNSSNLLEAENVLLKLVEMIIRKSYAFFACRIADLRRPMTNSEPVHADLMQARFLYDMICRESADCTDVGDIHHNDATAIAAMVRQDYIDTAGKIAYTYICNLEVKLFRLILAEPSWSANARQLAASNKQNEVSLYCLSERDHILTCPYTDHVIVPHLTGSDARFPLDYLFRSFHIVLLDTGCREYIFMRDFFSSFDYSDMFFSCFNRLFSYCYDRLKTILSTSQDCIGHILCMEILAQLSQIASSRNVPVFARFYQSMSNMLEKRLKNVVSMHCEVLENMCREVESGSGKDKINKRQNDSPFTSSPEYLLLTMRYPELLSALSVLELKQNPKRQSISNSINLLSQSLDLALVNVEDIWGLHVGTPARHTVSSILSARLGDQRTGQLHPVAQAHKDKFERSVHRIAEHIFEHSQFARLADMVRSSNPTIACSSDLTLCLAKFKLVVNSMQDWQQKLDEVMVDLMTRFNKLELSEQIFQRFLKVFVDHYCSFSRILSDDRYKEDPVAQRLPKIGELMTEIRRYKQNVYR